MCLDALAAVAHWSKGQRAGGKNSNTTNKELQHSMRARTHGFTKVANGAAQRHAYSVGCQMRHQAVRAADAFRPGRGEHTNLK